ncbi:MAG: amidohydrolase, partial [Bacteroidota bacterium]
MTTIDIHTHPIFMGEDYADRMVAEAPAWGIMAAVALGDVLRYGRSPSAEQVRAINAETAGLLERHPSFFIGFCHLNPTLGAEHVDEETRHCFGETHAGFGFRGIKLEIANNAA